MPFRGAIFSLFRALRCFLSDVLSRERTMAVPSPSPILATELDTHDIPGESPRERFIRYVQLLQTDTMSTCDGNATTAELRIRIHAMSESYEVLARQYDATDAASPDRVLSEQLTTQARNLDETRRLYARSASFEALGSSDSRPLLAEYAAAAFDALAAHPAVTRVTVERYQVAIDLATTTIEECGRRYEIGDFTLVWSFSSHSYRVHCRRTTSCIPVQPHPFWSIQSNSVCFGEANSELSMFLERMDLFGFVDLAVLMLSQPKSGAMQSWKEVPRDP